MKLLKTIKDTFLSTIPLLAIVIICLAISPLDNPSNYLKIIVGYLSIIIGQSLFLVGLDSSIIPIGHLVGSSFSKYKNVVFVLLFGFTFGLLATVAEPALSVLARQVSGVLPIISSMVFIWITSTGIGIGVAIALLRIIKNINVKVVFLVLYAVIFLLVIFSPIEFIAIAFDGSGATTGDVSGPFILALGIGISASFSKNKSEEDSLGIIGISSAGPIIAVLLYGIIVKAIGGGLPNENEYIMQIGGSYGGIFIGNLLDVALAVLPILVIAIPVLIFLIKIPKKELFKLLDGVVPVYIGLLIFLTGIDYGFEFVGQYIGKIFFDQTKPQAFKYLLLLIGFVLGFAITISEPAVTVLGSQIEDLTNGHIKKNTIKLTLAIGIAVASLLCVLKILTRTNILYYLVPLYVISIVLMKFTPKLFVALAFDSGGVTGGALTSAFLTPLTLSIATEVAKLSNSTMSILTEGFGMISFISVTPLIAIQLLGIIYEVQVNKAKQFIIEEPLFGLTPFVEKTTTKRKQSKGGRKNGK